tara:strand:+ start:70 stop:336 length:267 start_codon:yes stop_codon:yes gene_type:complete
MSALKVIRITKKLSGTHNIFIISQPTSVNIKPADRLAIACIEKTTISLNPWALNFSSSLYEITNRLVEVMKRKFHPMPRNIRAIRKLI